MIRIYVLPVLLALLFIASCKKNEPKCTCTQHAVSHPVSKSFSFWNKQREETAAQIADAVGALCAHPKRDKKFQNNLERFKQLSLGRALLVQDSVVVNALGAFNSVAVDYYAGKHTEYVFKQAGTNLVLCMRKELVK